MFKHRNSQESDQGIFFKDRFHQVEIGIKFKRIRCYQCDLEAIYKYRAKQIWRHSEIRTDQGEEIRPDHREIWQTIPRYAEIPETLRCKRCREILSLDILCIY